MADDFIELPFDEIVKWAFVSRLSPGRAIRITGEGQLVPYAQYYKEANP